MIGRSGENAAELRAEITKVARKVAPLDRRTVKFDIVEVRQPETDAAVVAAMVAEGLEKRMPFRRVLKQTVEKVKAVREVEGVRITISGRLGGAEMSRKEEIKRGRIPLQTFRADIDWPMAKLQLRTRHRHQGLDLPRQYLRREEGGKPEPLAGLIHCYAFP